MTKKIFRSIFTVALVVLLASIGIATSFLYDYFNDSQINQLKAELSLVADTVNEVGIEYFENFESSVFRFTIVDADGTVLYDTEANAAEMENHADREEIVETLETGNGSSVRNSETMTKKTYYEAVLLKNYLDENSDRIINNIELANYIYRSPDYCLKLFVANSMSTGTKRHVGAVVVLYLAFIGGKLDYFGIIKSNLVAFNRAKSYAVTKK